MESDSFRDMSCGCSYNGSIPWGGKITTRNADSICHDSYGYEDRAWDAVHDNLGNLIYRAAQGIARSYRRDPYGFRDPNPDIDTVPTWMNANVSESFILAGDSVGHLVLPVSAARISRCRVNALETHSAARINHFLEKLDTDLERGKRLDSN